MQSLQNLIFWNSKLLGKIFWQKLMGQLLPSNRRYILCIILYIPKLLLFSFNILFNFYFPRFYFLRKKFKTYYLILHFLNYSHLPPNFKINCYFLHYLSSPNWLVILMLVLLLLNQLLLNFWLLLIIMLHYRFQMLNLFIITFVNLKNCCQKELLFIF